MTPSLTVPVATMDRVQAQEFMDGWNAEIRSLSRRRRSDLELIERSHLRAAGIQRISGGPRSKDELITAILEYRYPSKRHSEALHVLNDGNCGSACRFCHPHTALGCCNCGLGNA